MKRTGRLCLIEDAGVIAPATAVVMAVLIGMVGMVTDTSVWFAQRRQLQGVTDAAALAAAPYAANLQMARAKAVSVLTSNGLDPTALLAVQTGSYCPDIATTVNNRFHPGGCLGAATTTDTAVQISTTIDSPLFLSKMSISGNRRIETSATAARVNQAGLEAGSGVASLNGGVANALLSALTGGSIALSAVQYDGLLKTKLDALTFFDALATKLNLTAGTYSNVLDSNIGVGDLIGAQIAALGQQQQTADVVAAIAGLTLIKGQIPGNQQVALGKLFDLGLWADTPVGGSASSSALHAGLNLWQLTTFSLQLANGNNFATIPASSIGVPGVVSIKIAATAIEPPVRGYFAFGPEGISVHTAQVRLKLDLDVLNLVPQIGLGVKVPLYVEVGSGDARVDTISCSGAPATDAKVGVTAHGGVANIYIGAPTDDAMRNFSAPVAASAITPVQILNIGLPGILTLSSTVAKAHVAIGSTTGPGTALTFVQPTGSVVQPVPPSTKGIIGRPAFNGVAASPAVWARAISTGFTSNLLGGLAETLEAKVCTASLLNLCLLPITLTGAGVGPLFNVLDPVLSGLDSVLDGLLQTLGVQLGYVDVSVTGVRCGLPVLVS
ncbi:hypothetical protein D3Y57_11300 [Sphingomonas paeninsulae]|uniref:Putative Flp pilus-assembly TadG-like N-terminal domain-containing protein n=1 Tax=Sphingomonas paeninsulae TaxID=2319844 RepID=A0A494TG97_SPHPE|nr:pilus assembly protein TadG-related protein [Sphingomonas paeninsulae]AYJ86444.1 hypothetical protein D3Y57_11300 [Sphingomonas paeninsulae]